MHTATHHAEIRYPVDRDAVRIGLELLGALTALVLAMIAVWHMGASPRGWLLFSDGDSVLPLLLRSSIEHGGLDGWMSSAVLFIPETAVFLVVALLVPAGRDALAVNAVLNLIGVYLALRLTAGVLTTDRRRAVLASAAGVAVLVALTLLEDSPAWDSPELASLIMTTTYYSATLVAAMAMPALVVVALRGSRRAEAATVAIGVVAAVSALTNPMFVGWSLVPLAIVGILLLARRLAAPGALARVGLVLLGGAAAGLVARIPFAAHIARDASAYLDPMAAPTVLVGYYVRLVAERLQTPLGVASIAVTVGLTVLCAIQYSRAARSRDRDTAVVAASGMVTGPVVLIGVICLGVPAFRYLQPAVFAPLIGIVVMVLQVVRPEARRLRRRTLAVVAAVLTAAGVVAGSGVAMAASAPDRSRQCVVDWVDAHHRVGAGRFQTIRTAKAYLRDPTQLVQVTAHFRAWPWLVDRDDYAVGRVSFVVSGEGLTAPVLPAGTPDVNPSIVRCGRYTIADYHRPVLEIGAPTSRYDP